MLGDDSPIIGPAARPDGAPCRCLIEHRPQTTTVGNAYAPWDPDRKSPVTSVKDPSYCANRQVDALAEEVEGFGLSTRDEAPI